MLKVSSFLVTLMSVALIGVASAQGPMVVAPKLPVVPPVVTPILPAKVPLQGLAMTVGAVTMALTSVFSSSANAAPIPANYVELSGIAPAVAAKVEAKTDDVAVLLAALDRGEVPLMVNGRSLIDSAMNIVKKNGGNYAEATTALIGVEKLDQAAANKLVADVLKANVDVITNANAAALNPTTAPVVEKTLVEVGLTPEQLSAVQAFKSAGSKVAIYQATNGTDDLPSDLMTESIDAIVAAHAAKVPADVNGKRGLLVSDVEMRELVSSCPNHKNSFASLAF